MQRYKRLMVLAAFGLVGGVPALGLSQEVIVDPPKAVFKTHAASQRTGPSTYCWPREGNPEQNICADSFIKDVERYIPGRHGSTATFEILFDERPSSVRLAVYKPIPEGADRSEVHHGEVVLVRKLNPALVDTWRIPLDPGRYVVSLSAYWRAGHDKDATWDFGLRVPRVDAVLPTTGGPLAASDVAVTLMVMAIALSVALLGTTDARGRTGA